MLRTILVFICFLAFAVCEEIALTPAQMMAVLTFTDVQSIDVAELAEGEDPADPGVRAMIAVDPVRKVAKDRLAAVTGVIAATVHYRFEAGALCFEPGLRIRVYEPQRTVTLSVCLKCSKMAVSTAAEKPFMIDYSPAGEQAYKMLYNELMVLKQGLEQQ